MPDNRALLVDKLQQALKDGAYEDCIQIMAEIDLLLRSIFEKDPISGEDFAYIQNVQQMLEAHQLALAGIQQQILTQLVEMQDKKAQKLRKAYNSG